MNGGHLIATELKDGEACPRVRPGRRGRSRGPPAPVLRIKAGRRSGCARLWAYGLAPCRDSEAGGPASETGVPAAHVASAQQRNPVE